MSGPRSGIVDVWRRPIGWVRDHPFAADALLAGLLTVLALVIHATSPQLDAIDPVRDPRWWTPLLVVAATLPVMYRRRHPIAALVAVTSAQVACEVLDIVGPSWLAVLVAIYSLGAHTEGRPRLRTVVALGSIVGLLLVAGVVEDEITLLDAIASVCMFTAAFVLGDNLRRRRLHVESLADRAERAEREREILARERVAEERARIARELHDIVAHSVSVMVIQAAAARRSMTNRPEAAEGLLANIERTGRETMDELRQVLGVLRNADAEPLAMPVPTLADLSALVDTSAGLPVRLAVIGGVDHVPAGVGVSVYRIVQEALTNANRHAGPGATVDVRVTCTATGIDVRVEDDGRGASVTRMTDGYGLVGMNERVTSAGGVFAAGPRSGGGWRVSARFPLQPGAAATPGSLAAPDPADTRLVS